MEGNSSLLHPVNIIQYTHTLSQPMWWLTGSMHKASYLYLHVTGLIP